MPPPPRMLGHGVAHSMSSRSSRLAVAVSLLLVAAVAPVRAAGPSPSTPTPTTVPSPEPEPTTEPLPSGPAPSVRPEPQRARAAIGPRPSSDPPASDQPTTEPAPTEPAPPPRTRHRRDLSRPILAVRRGLAERFRDRGIVSPTRRDRRARHDRSVHRHPRTHRERRYPPPTAPRTAITPTSSVHSYGSELCRRAHREPASGHRRRPCGRGRRPRRDRRARRAVLAHRHPAGAGDRLDRRRHRRPGQPGQRRRRHRRHRHRSHAPGSHRGRRRQLLEQRQRRLGRRPWPRLTSPARWPRSTTPPASSASRPRPVSGPSGCLNSQGFGHLSWYVCGLDWIAAQRGRRRPGRREVVNMSVAKSGSGDRACAGSERRHPACGDRRVVRPA